jgi:class 3 adenylate cyclase
MSGIPEFQNRTLICSVLFVDIVEYSRKSVLEQTRRKDRFNALLSAALRGVAIDDRIILDTGDGAAVSFIGDPEDALFVATTLRDLAESSSHDATARLSTRMGINLGPVRLVKDSNGQPNIIGDGINVAQRVMTFAKPGQVLVSRSYYEVVSRLSEESSKLFSYEGARTDKHVREHEVYAVGSVPAPRRRPEVAFHEDIDAARPARSGVALMGGAASFKHGLSRLLRSSAVASLVAVLAIVGIAFAVRDYREERMLAAARLAAAQRESSQTPAAPMRPIRGMPPEPAKSAERQRSDSEARTSGGETKEAAKDKAKAREKAVATQETIRQPARAAAVQETAPAAAPAMLTFAVSPWGEVHVNGKLQGVSPPLQELEIGPGRYRIEIRNGAAQPHVVTVNAKSGERIRIKHKFE